MFAQLDAMRATKKNCRAMTASQKTPKQKRSGVQQDHQPASTCQNQCNATSTRGEMHSHLLELCNDVCRVPARCNINTIEQGWTLPAVGLPCLQLALWQSLSSFLFWRSCRRIFVPHFSAPSQFQASFSSAQPEQQSQAILQSL